VFDLGFSPSETHFDVFLLISNIKKQYLYFEIAAVPDELKSQMVLGFLNDIRFLPCVSDNA